MKQKLKNPPRSFRVGQAGEIEILDFGEIFLQPNEQVTFVTESGRNFDFACKDWGFYATPSINGRLVNEGFRTALVENMQGRIYIMAVDRNKIDLFDSYCRAEQQTILRWLDEHPAKDA